MNTTTPPEIIAEQIPENFPQKPSTKKYFLVGLLIVVCLTILILVISLNGFTPKNNQELSNEKVTSTKSTINSLPSSPSSSIVPSKPEDVAAITADVTLSYWFTPKDEKITSYKQVDFQTNTTKEYIFPHPKTLVTKNDSLVNSDYVYYQVSPDNKYIVRISEKKLDIAPLTKNPVYKTIHEVPVKVEKSEFPSNPDTDFLHMGDVYWQSDTSLLFLVSAGIDGLGVPKGGAYSDLYEVNVDGSKKRLLNDHTKENQNYGFLRKFYAVDSQKRELYLSQNTHGGHLGTMDVINLDTGEIKKTLEGLSSDAGNPVFNKDFSKAYYIKSLIYSDGFLPTHLYEYNMNSGQQTLLYTVPGFTKDETSSSLRGLMINTTNNKLYFEEAANKARIFYQFDNATKQKKPLYTFDNKENCNLLDVSQNEKYILLRCFTNQEPEYYLYDIDTKIKKLFYRGSLDIVNFK